MSAHVFTIKQRDDEHVEYSIDGLHLITANHEDDGWSGMSRIDRLVKAIAGRIGAQVKEVSACR